MGSHKTGLIYEWNEKIANHLILSNTTFGILFLLVGICAQLFSSERLYVFLFGLFCLLPIINGVLRYVFWGQQNSTIILIMSLLNLCWIVATILLFLIYKLLLTNSFFEDDIVFQFSLLFILLSAIALAVSYYIINRALSPDPKPEVKPHHHKRASKETSN